MGFLKKWFSNKSAPPEVEKKAPSFKNRATRIPVRGLEFLSLRISDVQYEVLNLSTSGVGFLSEDPQFRGDVPLRFKVRFFLHESPSEFEIEVVRQNLGVVGARWVELPPEFKQKLFQMLEPERVAVEMLRVKDELLEAQPDGRPVFYSASGGNELYFVASGGRVLRGTLNWFGNLIEFSSGKKPKIQVAGRGVGDSRTDHKKLYEVVVSSLSPGERQELLCRVARLIQALPGLEEEFRQSLLECLRDSLQDSHDT